MAQKATEDATDAQPAEYRAAARINRDHAALAQTDTRTISRSGNARRVSEFSEDDREALLSELRSGDSAGTITASNFSDRLERADADDLLCDLIPYGARREHQDLIESYAYRHGPGDAVIARNLVELVQSEVEALATHKYADDGEQLFFECEATGRLEPFKFHKSGKYAGKQVKNSRGYYDSIERHLRTDQVLCPTVDIRALRHSDRETIGEAVAAPDGLERAMLEAHETGQE